MPRLGMFTKVWVEGYALTTRMISAVASDTRTEVEVGGYTENMVYLNGRADGTINLQGFFDDTANMTHDAFKTISASAASIVTVAYGNNAVPAVGDPTASLDAQEVNYEATPDLNGAIGVTATMKARGQPVHWGILLADATVTANGNQSSVDQTAQTTAGAVGYFHITALSAGDTITINIQDSADDAAWADLITCTLDGTAIDGERVAVTGTVDRYVRAEYVVTGAAISFPIAVAFERL